MAIIKLHGELAEKFNNEYNLDVNSPKEAVRALCLMVPTFRETFSQGNYFLYVEGNEITDIDESNYDFASTGTINIVPEISGSKSGLGKIVAGIAMIGLAFVPGVGQFALAALSYTPLAGTALVNAAGLAVAATASLGLSMVLGGAAMMLAPKVNPNSQSAEKQQSYIFDGSDINISNGAPVPVIYGTVLAAAFPISVEISDSQAAPVNPDTGYNNSAGGWGGYYQQNYEIPDTV